MGIEAIAQVLAVAGASWFAGVCTGTQLAAWRNRRKLERLYNLLLMNTDD
jgi:hypothetical protein